MATPKDIRKLIEKEMKDRFRVNARLRTGFERAALKFRAQMIKLIKTGISPINQKKRFPAYINPTNYPDKVRSQYPGKRRRPVNLTLSGEFLSDLIVEFRNIKRTDPNETRMVDLFLGFATRKSELKERGHREGAGGQPKRPIIPRGNEQFAQTLSLLLKRELIKLFNA